MLTINLASCVGELDFDQANDLEIEPAFSLSLLTLDFSNFDEETGIILDLTQSPQHTTSASFDGDNDFFQDNLDSAVFQFEATNSFPGSFTMNIVLLDENNLPVFEFQEIIIPANTDDFSPEDEEVFVNTNPEILEAQSVVGVVSYNGSESTTEPGRLTFQAAGDFYLNIGFD